MTPEGIERLIEDEGIRTVVYNDKDGQAITPLTVGGGYATIGIGRNLVTRGLSVEEVHYLFHNDIAAIEEKLSNAYPWAGNIPSVWWDVMCMVEFNTGNVGAFSKMLAGMANGDQTAASSELMCSRAAAQNHARYLRMACAIVNRSWTKRA